MKSLAVLTLTAMLAVLTILGASSAMASKFTYGQVRLEYAEPPTPNAPWHFRIWALNYRDFENGKLLICGLPIDGSKTPSDVVLWAGSRAAHDTIFAEYTAPPPPPGNYMVYASLVPFPERGGNAEHTADVLYVTVRENQVLTDRGSWTGNYYQEILQELEARGLKGASDEEIREKAPDLAGRIEGLSSTMIPAQRPSDSSSGAEPAVPGQQDSVVTPPLKREPTSKRPPGLIYRDPQLRLPSQWERRVDETMANRPAKLPRSRPERHIKDSTRTRDTKDSLLNQVTLKRLKPE